MGEFHSSVPEDLGLGAELVIRTDAVARNSAGTYQLLELETLNLDFSFPAPDLIYHNLQLVYGIGAATAMKLKEAGYTSIKALVNHARWSKAAKELLRIIERHDVSRLLNYGASDLELLSFFQPDELSFIDIETTGLFYMFPVFLIGVLQFRNGKGRLRQFLARNFDEELAILTELSDDLRNQGVIVSYNGKSFDIPYLKGRLRFYQLDDRFDAFHLDLLGHARRQFRQEIPNCRLTTIEKFVLNQGRAGDLPGSEVPEFYRLYMDTGDRFYIDPILRHNACDLLALAKLMGILIPAKRGKAVADGY